MTTDQTALVLLVDDDEDLLMQHELVLKKAGYEVVTAASQAEAKELLTTVRPDAAVFDLMMEEMDAGFTLCHHIKAIDPSIPTLLVTGVAHETGMNFDVDTAADRQWIKADVVLAKPVRPEQLTGTIARLLTERK
jgi:CheY-like chemotaxis protein